MMSQPVSACNDLKAIGPSSYTPSSTWLKDRTNKINTNNNNNVNNVKNNGRNSNSSLNCKTDDDMVSQFIPVSSQPQHDYYNRNSSNKNNTNNDSMKDINICNPLLYNSYDACSSTEVASPASVVKTAAVSCSSPNVACCLEEQDPQQAQPLLVGVKVINEWPNRNGSISVSTSGGPNGPILGSPYKRSGAAVRNDSAAAGDRHEEDKLDIYSLNGTVAIDVPSSGSENADFPQEKIKTFVALVILMFSFFFTTISLAIVHDRVPDRKVYKPLPDTFLDLIAARDWALTVSEIFIMITTNITLFIVIAHKHRYIVFRRMFLILSLLYCMRSITMFVTVLPVSSETYECSEKVDRPTFGVIIIRALQLCSGLGLTINGKHTYCGDYIYSGHTTILVMGYLTICEYSPRRYYLLHWSAWMMAFIGVLMVLVSHGHYTVDVIVAYFITTRLFWLYHTLANNPFLKEKTPTNYLAREWWFRFFKYFEGNVKGPVPLEYNFPLKWPRVWSRSYRCNNS